MIRSLDNSRREAAKLKLHPPHQTSNYRVLQVATPSLLILTLNPSLLRYQYPAHKNTNVKHLLYTLPTANMAEEEQPPTTSAGGFPTDPADFDSDPRISFSKLDNKFILETEDGQEYEYDSALKRWVQTVCLVACPEVLDRGR